MAATSKYQRQLAFSLFAQSIRKSPCQQCCLLDSPTCRPSAKARLCQGTPRSWPSLTVCFFIADGLGPQRTGLHFAVLLRLESTKVAAAPPMHRQPFSNAKHRDNAQLPETFPIIKNAAKDYNTLRKRKERPANHDLRVSPT